MGSDDILVWRTVFDRKAQTKPKVSNRLPDDIFGSQFLHLVRGCKVSRWYLGTYRRSALLSVWCGRSLYPSPRPPLTYLHGGKRT